MTTMGPYETEAEALAGPLYAEVHVLRETGRGSGELRGQVVRDAQLRHLMAACEAAGVELGAHDRRILGWLAGYETSTVQVIIGIITRANAIESS